jgi:hypothetical protein
VKHLVLLILAVLAFSSGCNNPSNSDNMTLAKAIEEEQYNEWSGDTIEHRKQVRQAILNHMVRYLPEWSIQGLALHSRFGYYTICVDGVSGGKRQTLYFRVDLFVKGDGEMYWKTEQLPTEASEKPFDFVIESYTLTERKE